MRPRVATFIGRCGLKLAAAVSTLGAQEHVRDGAREPPAGPGVCLDLPEAIELDAPGRARVDAAAEEGLWTAGAVDLLVVDSAAALVPRLELEAPIGESGYGLHGRVLAAVRAAAAADQARR